MLIGQKLNMLQKGMSLIQKKKQKNRIANSVDPDESASHEPSMSRSTPFA